jgi:hypothetical protein
VSIRPRTSQERDELRMIFKLQGLNCYGAIVKRLTEGQSANSVARWASELKVEGAAGAWSYLYWRKLILPLAKEVRQAKDKLRTRRPVTSKVEAVIERVSMHTAELLVKDKIPDSAQEVWTHVEKTMNLLKAEQILKFAFFRQVVRVELMVAIEEKLGILFPNGYKEIDALRRIGDSIGKLELEGELMHGKGGNLPHSRLITSLQPQLVECLVLLEARWKRVTSMRVTASSSLR